MSQNQDQRLLHPIKEQVNKKSLNSTDFQKLVTIFL